MAENRLRREFLEILFKKARDKRAYVPKGNLEGFTYYDGFRAGLTWMESILAEEINVTLGWERHEAEPLCEDCGHYHAPGDVCHDDADFTI